MNHPLALASAPIGDRPGVLTHAPVLIVLPGFVLLYVLDQRTMLPEEGVD